MKVETTAKYWQSVTVNSQVTLTDAIALEASMAEGRGMQGMDYAVKEVTSITESNHLCQWIMFKLEHPSQVLYMVVKLVGDNCDIRVYYNPEAVPPGNRADQINAQNIFMFENYKPHSHNNLLKLVYANTINWTFDDGSGPKEVIFRQKGNMEFTGKAIVKPSLSPTGESLIATISEYLAETDCKEPEIMIVEIGNPKNTKGGNILLLVGNMVNEFEVSIVRK